ncbi:hypothetical protein [Lysinibacillus sp. RC79]|uniref:hypothetical protein n=1 Tax=Lysinibacillus sp. RC79 TaxID=3156296 RepID=UPI003512EE6F
MGRLHNGIVSYGYYWGRNTKTAEIHQEVDKGNVVHGRYGRSADGKVLVKENEENIILNKGIHQRKIA